MKTRSIKKITGLIVLAVCGGAIVMAELHGGGYTSADASALSYSTTSDVSFTFAPKLSISMSDTNLVIDNLVPGQTSNSNAITVTVASNTPYGYSLYADAGSNDTTSTYYNTSSLVHSDNTINNTFTSIATNASLAQLTTDNTWGYSTSTDNGTTWSTYNGLPTATSTESSTSTNNPALLIDTKDPADSSKSIDFKVAARASTTQASGTYSNVINFYAVGKPYTPPTLYEEVAKMSKGTQTALDLQAAITTPTSADYREDTSNSGVYEYNTAVFGGASDASNANKIYYYRGILEQTADQGSYGSDGKATTYPNYVKLANNTCWRIVRTTGSGGVKMIYNGTWQGTAESGTCANNQNNAQLTTLPFNISSATVAGKAYTGLPFQSMHAIGYTYSNVAPRTTSSTTLGTLLGATGDDTTTNNKSSIIKQYIEDWYSTDMANSTNNYTSILEESAGYCNDRSVYSQNSYAASTVLPDSTTVIPYGTKKMTQYFFGACTRNFNTAQNPSLTCPRGTVDTYSTTTASGGNGQLAQPTALLTADELSFAGSGSPTASQGSSYNAKSYLRSGSQFWLLSPTVRISDGTANGFYLTLDGFFGSNNMYSTYGVRPAISLKPGTTVASGEGTATNPWTINE